MPFSSSRKACREPAFFRLSVLGEQSRVQYSAGQGKQERAINISRKSISDGDNEAEEDQSSGEAPPRDPH